MAIVYRLYCKETGKFYIGSTTKSIEDRLYRHVYYSIEIDKNMRKLNRSPNSYEIIKGGKYDIEALIETDKTGEDLLRLERDYIEAAKIESGDLCLNIKRPIIDDIDRKKCARLYYEKNKDKLLESFKIWRLKNSDTYSCPCGSNVLKYAKSSHFKSKKHCNFIEQSKCAIPESQESNMDLHV